MYQREVVDLADESRLPCVVTLRGIVRTPLRPTERSVPGVPLAGGLRGNGDRANYRLGSWDPERWAVGETVTRPAGAFGLWQLRLL